MVAVYVVICYTEKVGAALAPSESPLGSRGGLPGEGGLLGEGETPGGRGDSWGTAVRGAGLGRT